MNDGLLQLTVWNAGNMPVRTVRGYMTYYDWIAREEKRLKALGRVTEIRMNPESVQEYALFIDRMA
jgi:hypothetical protein